MRGAIPFADRSAAGRALAEALVAKKIVDPVVLALPRGGVPVAAEIAKVLPQKGNDLLFRMPLPFHRPAPLHGLDSRAFWTKSWGSHKVRRR